MGLKQDQMETVVNAITEKVINGGYTTFNEIVENNSLQHLFTSNQMSEMEDVTVEVTDYDEDSCTIDVMAGDSSYECDKEDAETRVKLEVKRLLKGITE